MTDAPSQHPVVQSKRIPDFEHLETGSLMAYRSSYSRIFWHLDQADHVLAGDGTKIDYADLIRGAAHLRLTIEHVALASFIASHRLVVEAQRSINEANSYDKARKVLKKLNPHFWPVSFGPVEVNGQWSHGVRPNLGLTESEVGLEFGHLSEMLHAQSPYKGAKREPQVYLDNYLRLATKLRSLLVSHVIQLADSAETVLLWVEDEGEIRVKALKTERPLLG